MTSIPQLTRRPGWARRGGVSRPAATTPAGDHERLWLPLAVVAAALLGVAGWLLLVSPVRADTGALHDQTAGVTQQVDTLRAQLVTLRSQQADLPRFTAELRAAQAALPTTAALPTFLRTLQDIGSRSGVDVTGLTATPPAPVTANGGATAAGPAAVYQVSVSLTARGDFDRLTTFVEQLQQVQPRAVLVSDTSVTADSDGTALTLSLAAFFAPGGGAKAGG